MQAEEAALDALIIRYRRSAYAETTKAAYRSQLQSYHGFCAKFRYLPLPASTLIISRYIAYISLRISTSSIPPYLNIIRLLHMEAGLSDPFQSNFHISSLIKGVHRHLASPPKQKLPITPAILLQMHAHLDFSRPILVSFWAACLVAFYSFFRKSTLLAKSSSHSCKTEFCIRDLIISPTTALLNVKHTKTLQFFNRLVQVPLPHIPNSPLCPISALHKLLSLLSGAPPSLSLFSYPLPGGGFSHLTYPSFSKLLGIVLGQSGISPSLYSGHSFRRGGASFAFACGIPSDLIKIQGDWSSDAYLRYLTSPLSSREKLVHSLSLNIQKL